MQLVASDGRAVAPMVPTIHRVVARRVDLDDTVTLGLDPVAHALVPPAPGQFNMLWAFGIGEAPISIAGVEGGTLVHTIRRVGAVTAALCALEPGDTVGVRGPFGFGWNVDRATGHDLLVVAGGLGLAPLRPLLLGVLANRARFGRVVLLVGARSPEQLLYLGELDEWARELDVEITVDSSAPTWRGHVGVVTKLIARAEVDPARTIAYVCGPEIMMRFAAMAAVDLGLDPSAVWVSLERNMHCAIGHCGHCQLGPLFVCKDGPVVSWPVFESLIKVRER